MASGRQGNDCLPDRCSPSGADHIRGELESPVALLMGYALEDPAVFSDLGDQAVSLVDGRGERLIGEASWPLRTATRSTGMCQRSAVALAGTSTPVMWTPARFPTAFERPESSRVLDLKLFTNLRVMWGVYDRHGDTVSRPSKDEPSEPGDRAAAQGGSI